MIALVATPGIPGSIRTVDLPPTGTGTGTGTGSVPVRTLEVGICGTDREIDDGAYGSAPPGRDDLVIGHEVVGVVEAGAAGLESGDLVVATVRRSCGHCTNCASGAYDCCLTGDCPERGMLGLDGFAVEVFYEAPQHLIRVPQELRRVAVLAEPLSVCERGLRHARAIAARQPHRWSNALVLGAGAIGMLSALLLRLEGLHVTVVSRGSERSEKAVLARRGGADYVSLADSSIDEVAAAIGNVDVLVEATGSAQIVHEAIAVIGINGVGCLLGIDAHARPLEINAIELGQRFVEHNKALVGSVNAAYEDWTTGVSDLVRIRHEWPGLLEEMIGLRASIEQYRSALSFRGVKATVSFSS